MADRPETPDLAPDPNEATRIWNLPANPKYHPRSPERIVGLVDGLELVEPGVVSVTAWKPDGPAGEIDQYCAVARKP